MKLSDNSTDSLFRMIETEPDIFINILNKFSSLLLECLRTGMCLRQFIRRIFFQSYRVCVDGVLGKYAVDAINVFLETSAGRRAVGIN